jgi:hypothetical protein
MSRYFPRGFRSLRYRTVRFALVAAAPMLAVALCRSPEAFASSPVIHSAGKAATAPAALTLSVAARPHHPSDVTLAARLQSGSGDGGRTISFFVVSTEFAQPKDVPIGTAKTTADGTASVAYKPTWSGREKFIAKLTSPAADVPAATAYYRVTASTPGPLAAAANPARPLSSIGHVFLDVVLSIVALVWLGLIVMVALAVGWMPRLADRGID